MPNGKKNKYDLEGRTAEFGEDIIEFAKKIPKKIVEMKRIEKIFYVTNPPTHALRGIDLTVREGEFVAITGTSGSGKSTLMNIIGLLDRPTMGVYKLGGEDVTRLSENRIAEVRNRKIGFIFQSFHLLPGLTALENAELPMIYAGIHPRERKGRATKKLEAVGLGHRLHYRPDQLSGGQQQRVAVARALVLDPELILADEPTGNLDTKSTWEIMDIFTQFNKEGKTIIIITHDPEIVKCAKRPVYVKDGLTYDSCPVST